VISKQKILDLIFNSPLIHTLCVNVEDSYKKWRLDFYNTAPTGWVKVTSNLTLYSKENLLKHITMINILSPESIANPTDSGLRWKDLGPMFGMAGTNLVLYQNYTRMHLQAMFESALEENVQYLEARVTGLGMYVLDDSVSGGHRVIDNQDGDLWFQTATEEVEKFKKKHVEFIGYKEIVNGKRYANADQVENDLSRAFRLRQKYPHMIGGFDLVAEEDKGYSLLFFIDDFAKIHAENKTLPLYLHTSETSWPNDLMTSLHPLDPVSTLDNVYEAIILGAKRVGHGLGFIKHPYLMQVLKDRKIAIEVNPVSNMLLGYVTDQRQHPAVTYIRYGIPVVLGADDPGTMGYDEFTVDWYEAFMAWGLRLVDLHSLAINSLQYSTMTTAEKESSFKKYKVAWDKFISNMTTEACGQHFTATDAVIYNIYPTEGSINSSTTVKVFGRHFQAAICQQIICRFGSKHSIGRYVYNSLIMCDAPPQGGIKTSVNFSISLNSGQEFSVQNNLTFSYMHPFDKHDQSVASIIVG
jgi:adenosine deaminase CECR1